MSKNNKTIADALYIARHSKRESMKKVADNLCITEETVKKAETTADVNGKILYKLLEYYGLEIKIS